MKFYFLAAMVFHVPAVGTEYKVGGQRAKTDFKLSYLSCLLNCCFGESNLLREGDGD